MGLPFVDPSRSPLPYIALSWLPRAVAMLPSHMTAAAAALPTTVIVGTGRIGRALLNMNMNPRAVGVGRGDDLSQRLAATAPHCPVLVATTNDALPQVRPQPTAQHAQPMLPARMQ